MKIRFNKICGMMQKQWLEGKHGIEGKKKKKLTKISFLSFYLRKLEEKEQEEEKRKNKIQAKSNRIETGNRKAGKKRKINEIKSWFFEKIN